MSHLPRSPEKIRETLKTKKAEIQKPGQSKTSLLEAKKEMENTLSSAYSLLCMGHTHKNDELCLEAIHEEVVPGLIRPNQNPFPSWYEYWQKKPSLAQLRRWNKQAYLRYIPRSWDPNHNSFVVLQTRLFKEELQKTDLRKLLFLNQKSLIITTLSYRILPKKWIQDPEALLALFESRIQAPKKLEEVILQNKEARETVIHYKNSLGNRIRKTLAQSI